MPTAFPNVHWISYGRRSLQRLGHLKLVSALANRSGTTTLEGLTLAFEAAVSTKLTIPPDQSSRVIQYVSEQAIRERIKLRDSKPPEKIEAQDLYLSNPVLPSRSGAITGEIVRKGYRHTVHVEIPTWGVCTSLVRKQNYSLTDRGRAVLALAPDVLGLFRSYDTTRNPFDMSTAERAFFLYVILESDGDVIASLYRRLLSRDGFTRGEAGEATADSLAELRTDRLMKRSSGKAREAVRKMREIEKAIEDADPKSMGPRESFATPRTEPLVDCGVLRKPNGRDYVYDFTPGGKRFLSTLIESPSATSFIDERLGGATSDLFEATTTMKDESTILRYVARGYKMIRRGLGYLSLRELSALAIALAADEGVGGIELKDIEASILDAARSRGATAVRVTKSRGVGSFQARFSQAILEEWA